MAEIKKRSNKRYLVRVFLGRDPQTGRVQYHSKIIKGNRKEAQNYANKIETQVSTGQYVASTTMTLDEYLDKWLQESARHRLAENTFENYESYLARYVRPHLGAIRIDRIRPLEIQSLYNRMLESVSPRTVRYTHSILSSALKQAVKWRIISQNPAQLVDLPKKERKEMQAISSSQAERFLKEISKSPHYAVFALMLETGLRPSECMGLKRSDVDFERRLITVQRTLIWKKNGTFYFGETKTSQSRRQIPLSLPLLKILKHHLVKQGEDRLKLGSDYTDLELLFASRQGQPLRGHNLIKRHFKPALKRAELPQSIRFYDLRHSCATILLESGIHPKVVADRLGHSSTQLTLDTYSHVVEGLQKDASEAISKRIFKS